MTYGMSDTPAPDYCATPDPLLRIYPCLRPVGHDGRHSFGFTVSASGPTQYAEHYTVDWTFDGLTVGGDSDDT